ncbi:hypothetical protein V8E53_001337 [Lactarius tabidus]
MAEADHPWPENIHMSFNAAIANDMYGHGAATFFGPFTKLFYTLFSIYGPYDIVPQFKPEDPQGGSPERADDFVPVLLVEVDQHPVFFLEINHPVSLPYQPKREEADEQMRRKFRDLGPRLAIPTLHGVSAFGTRLAFYEYDLATRVIQPTEITQSDPSLTADVVPMSCWDSDVLQQEGADQLKDVVRKVKDMCAHM